MKKLLSLAFASLMVGAMAMPVFASGAAANNTTTKTAKTEKAKSNKMHKSTKANKTGSKTSKSGGKSSASKTN